MSGYYAELSLPDADVFTTFSLSNLNEVENNWKATCTYDFGTDSVYGPIINWQIVVRDCAAGFIALLDGSEPIVDDTMTVTFTDESSFKNTTFLLKILCHLALIFLIPRCTQEIIL